MLRHLGCHAGWPDVMLREPLSSAAQYSGPPSTSADNTTLGNLAAPGEDASFTSHDARQPTASHGAASDSLPRLNAVLAGVLRV